MSLVVALLETLPTQTPDPGSELIGTVIQSVGGVGAFGLIAWVLKRVFIHTIPRLAQDYKDALKEQQQTWMEEMKETRLAFKDEVHRQTEIFQSEILNQRENYRQELQREREFFANHLEKLTKAVENLERTIIANQNRFQNGTSNVING